MANLADELRNKNGEGFAEIKEELENLLRNVLGSGNDLIMDFDSCQKKGIAHHQYMGDWWSLPATLMPATLNYLHEEGFNYKPGPLYSPHNYLVYL